MTNIKIQINNDLLKATLDEHPASQDFLQKLPLTLTLKDLFRREKFIDHFPLDAGNSNISHFSRGDISYYLPNNALVFYYEGEKEGLNGLVKLGDVTKGIEILEKYPDNVEMTIEKE